MKKKILILFALFLALVSSAQTQFRAIPFDEVLKAAQQEKKIVFVDFYTDWCGPCKMMHPVLEQLKEDLGDSIRILKIDVDKNESLSETYRIQSVPTLMLFKEGKQLWRQSGAMRVQELKDLIAKFQ